MNYELAKRLKEAGFPQKIQYYEEFYCNGKTANYGCDEGLKDETEAHFPREGKMFYTNNEVVKIPTLSELIEECGDKFRRIERQPPHCKDRWLAAAGQTNPIGVIISSGIGGSETVEIGQSPEIAVAELWLALNEK